VINFQDRKVPTTRTFFKNNFYQIPAANNNTNTIIFLKRNYYYYSCELVENKIESTTAKLPTHGYTHKKEANSQYCLRM
jgi:hypothetical protein